MKKITEKKPGKIKSALLNFLGVPIDLFNTAFWSEMGGDKVAGQQVNETTSLKLSAVWACVRLISETISTLPLQIYERLPDGRRVAAGHALYDIVHTSPNADSTAAVFWEAMIVAMMFQGNGIAEKQYIGPKLVGLKFLDPRRLTINRDTAGNRLFTYTKKDGTSRDIPESRLFRVPGFTLDGDWGVSAIWYGANVIGSGLASQNAANSTFEKGMAPTIAFTVPGKVNPAQRDEFREMIRTKTGALQSGEPVILEQNMTAAPLGINPKDAQLLESRKFSVEEICRWFRVPPWMVGHSMGTSNWGTGIEQQMIGFLMFVIAPWLTRIEQHINKYLLSPSDQQKFYAEFNVEGLLRADSKSRAEYYGMMVDRGLMTRDEVRVKENFPPMGGNAAVLTVQSAMMPIDKLGENANEAQGPASGNA